MYEDYPSGRHLSETVEDFLRRLPPLTTNIRDHGPWIYIANPYSPKGRPQEDQATFVRKGRELLENFSAAKVKIEHSMAGKAKSVIGRKVKIAPKAVEVHSARPCFPQMSRQKPDLKQPILIIAT